MSPATRGEDGFRVGPWSVEPKGDLLRRGTHLVRVEPKVMDVLVYFAGRAGEVVSREELERDVWRGALVVYDAMTKTVTKLRQALGDDPRNPRFIQTVPKRGYRFVAEAERADPIEGSQPEASDRIRRPLGSPRRLLLVVILGVAVSASFLFYLGVLRPFGGPAGTPGGAVESSGPTDPVPPKVTRVLVLPFDVLGQDPDQLYLARGITADLIADLSKLSGLTVTGAESRSEAADIKEAASPGIRYEVWGGVQRAGDRIRAEVRLTDALSGRQLCVERYDRPFEDLFEVQQDIGSRLARALSVTLTEVEQHRIAHRYTRSVQAYDLFLRAQSQLLVRRGDENRRARDLYLQAIRQDPGFARAYAGLALTYAYDYRNQWSSDGAAALERAVTMAETAAEIDPTIPEVHWALGYVKVQQRRHQEALAHLDEALRLDPGFADALALKGGIETYAGRPRRTIPLARAAIQRNPGAGYLYYMILGRAYFFIDDQIQAMINLREAAMRNPEDLEVRVFLAAALDLGGEHQDAAWEAEEILAIHPDFSTDAWLDTYPMTDRDQRHRLVATLARLGL
ncbi:winged helix-turn-helix domain-containing protein [Thiocapsa roseopersicina]|uniref:DNA-binding winged helix-turn-helix (WHTH) domain-containing protein n=1 Tax=Thiocapsa roseopersicina TaxID=1058 RepID=A0A1H2W1Z3_THIRO|nr:winged helix-turn-helix domain-containing protein [Thiocapsa roseopersicina]SDW74517.1 DNA-binding winged helix-turn-helix (wHTH) domain-containing protein [Thiocapsa roseopersicina]